MSDHNERSCSICGSYLHHEDNCPKKPRYRVVSFLHGNENILVIDNRNNMICHCYCFSKEYDRDEITLEQAEKNAKDICKFLNERDKDK